MSIVSPNYIADLERYRLKAARVVMVDQRALPIFERLDREVEAAKQMQAASLTQDPVARARALLEAERMQA